MNKRLKKKLKKRYGYKKYNNVKSKAQSFAYYIIDEWKDELNKMYLDMIMFGEGRLLVTSETIKYYSILNPIVYE